MTRGVDVVERTSQWFEAFNAVRVELTPPEMRVLLAEMKEVEGVSQLSSYMSMARNVMANDRTAAVVAAMLTATGIKPTPVELDEVP